MDSETAAKTSENGRTAHTIKTWLKTGKTEGYSRYLSA